MIARALKLRLPLGLAAGLLLCACAPRPVYYPPRPASVAREPAASPPAPAEPASPAPEAKRGPVLLESSIEEQDIRGRAPSAPAESTPAPQTAPAGVEAPQTTGLEGLPPAGHESDAPTAKLESARGGPPRRAAEPVRPRETSLIAMIGPATHPREALSLRLAEDGRKLLEEGERQKALAQLEKAISIDARNRYAYYYLAQTHYELQRYRQSLNFLDIAESYFAGEPAWLAQALALQGRNFQALGSFERADESYLRALSLDPENRLALEGITQIAPGSAGSAR